MRRIGGRRIAVLAAVFALVITGSAWAAFQGLPGDGSQVNTDASPVSIEDPANSDVTGGSLAGGVEVPWAIFRQTESSGSDQIFVRAFKNGAWTTQGSGTTNGASSASPAFGASLNFDQTQDGEAPSIDFAGANRAVPWATWYEDNALLGGHEQIFASRFDSTSGKWIFAGQGRSLSSVVPPAIPSLNIHTEHDAVNPVVAGGSTADPTKPGPWVTWQESDDTVLPNQGPDQIFVSKPVGGAANCNGVKPAGLQDPPIVGDVPAIGGFCFQQVGIEREPSGDDTTPLTTDPSLNVDPTRDGLEPDMAFTGHAVVQDDVPWVVWYEDGTGTLGLSGKDLVFAAKGVADGSADGGFHWQAVGSGGSGVLDATTGATNHLGSCSETTAAEQACSLNSDATADAQDPRIAAGTMTAGSATVPWVAWEETVSGPHERIFVSRLVNGQFKIANGGQPLPTVVAGIDATRPDITFSGNTPYVSWHEGSSVASGHFTTPDNFVIDNTAVGTNVPDAVRAPISSGCTANPFNNDGAACQANAIGTPFFLFTDGTTPKLLADAYQTDAPVTGGPSLVSSTAAIVTGSINPQGGPVRVAFQYGTTTNYELGASGTTTIAPTGSATGFSGTLAGLPAATPIHYRAVAATDFGTVVGNDQTLTTGSAPPPPKDTTKPVIKLSIVKTTIRKLLKAKKLKVKVTLSEPASFSLTTSARARVGKKSKTGSVGKASGSATKAGTKTVSIKLSAAGRRLLRHASSVKITVKGRATDLAGNKSPTRKSIRTLKR